VSKKPKIIPLENARVTGGNKGIIKVSIPDAPCLLLKTKNQKEFNVWYSNIKVFIVNSKTRATFKQLEKTLKKIENAIARTDKKEVLAVLSDIESVLKTEERRIALFKGLGRHKPEYKHLGELYNLILAFSTMQKLNKSNSAISSAKEIYKMITDFRIEDKHNTNLEQNINDMFKSIANKEIIENIDKNIKLYEAGNTVSGIFNPLTQNILNTIEALRNEILGKTKRALTVQELELLAIPISMYKKSINWIMPRILQDLKFYQANLTAYKKYTTRGATRLIKNLNLAKVKLTKQSSRNEQSIYMNSYRTHREANVLLDM